jgi:16S rRNA (uracil1498-N3)-methyltransferase
LRLRLEMRETVHRCWLGGSEPLVTGSQVTLSAEESAHVAVLRMKAGDRVQMIAAEQLYEGQLTLTDAKAATVRVLAALPSPEAPVRITLVQGLPKADKLEWIAQKATELGAWDVLPVEMARSIAHAEGKEGKKRERWNRIVLEAAKQSGRAHVPEVYPVCRFSDAIAYLKSQRYDAVFVAWEEEGEVWLSQALKSALSQSPQPRALAVVIGPEGGITTEEVEQFKAIGAQCVSLGKRILRTETAGLCALAVIMSALGEM